MSKLSQIKAVNRATVDKLTSSSDGLKKEAAGTVDTYLRLRARDEGVARAIITPVPVTADNLDRSVRYKEPVIIKDVEGDTQSATTVPFGGLPMGNTIEAPRYEIPFARLMSDRFREDRKNLLTYNIDIKKMFNDLLLLDIMDQEDIGFFGAVDYAAGPKDVVAVGSDPHYQEVGSRGYVSIGSLSGREDLTQAFKGIPSSNRNLNTAIAVLNNVTIWDIVAFDSNVFGDALAEELFKKGFVLTMLMGIKLIITVKKNLVPTDSMYMFTSPEALGDFYVLEDITLSNESENFMLELFAYNCIGSAIKNSGGIAKVDFSGTQVSWQD